METNIDFLDRRMLDVFSIADVAALKALIWSHEEGFEDEPKSFFSEEEIADIKAGYDPGTILNSIQLSETGGDRIVELHDPQGNVIYNGRPALEATAKLFAEDGIELKGFQP